MSIVEIPRIPPECGSVVNLFVRVVRKSGCKMSSRLASKIIGDVLLFGKAVFDVVPQNGAGGIYGEILVSNLFQNGFVVVR